ncbi:MAG: recombinase family protein [Candidatus Gastranaerophilales bacterium]|nr:recombinase family protein [Candidatus Gastranaerophilales bacterium]
MNFAAYCRVSTDKEDQLNSLETQKEFFKEYAEKNGHHLVKVYADEGISGTSTKHRTQFLRLMKDAERGMFEMVAVKDISRLARNTVDLLQSIRRLRELNINVVFITANMETMSGDSEFTLTIFGALAQEESANMSKRVKFGKKENAKKGRVPNLVYGYNKTKGDYFNLTINEEESEVVKQIFKWYTKDGYGYMRIAEMLNEKGLKTKRGSNFEQVAVARILHNEIYTGKIINGKQETKDFLTGVREKKDQSEWLITEKQELRIVSDETFEAAQKLFAERRNAFHIDKRRQSNKHLFSTLIRCKNCGRSFRRLERTFKKTYARWVCSGHNASSKNCDNGVSVDEDELIGVLDHYFTMVLNKKEKVYSYVIGEFKKVYKSKNEDADYEKKLKSELTSLRKKKDKFMDLFVSDLITKEELTKKITPVNDRLKQLERDLKLVESNLTTADEVEDVLKSLFKKIEDFSSVRNMTNAQLKQIIEKIEVDSSGQVDIFFRVFGDFGFDTDTVIEQELEEQDQKNVLITNDYVEGEH